MSIIGGINLGNLPNYLLFYSNGSIDANWQGATKGFIGDVAVNGIVASERTSGGVPYAGTIYTNDTTLGAWQAIVDQNPTQASGVTGQTTLISNLTQDLVSAIQQINALSPTPSFESRSSASLDGLNTQNGINEVFVINVTSGLNFSNQINITGDAGDVYILRWDEDGNPANGYQGQLKPQSGGVIVPHGGLTPTNFINVAGDIGSSGGGTTPPPPYPQGPRYDDGTGSLIIGGSDFSGGGFFTGYLLTTGAPTILDPTTGLWYGETSPLSNGIFVGGWYSITTSFSMTSGTSGVYVSPNPATVETPAIDVKKDVSPDNGVTWYPADTPPGPNVTAGTNPQFRFTVTNTGNVPLTNVQVTDNVYGSIGTVASLAPGASEIFFFTGTWALGQQVNTATATGNYLGQILVASNPAYWFGIETPAPLIDVLKDVSPDNGTTWFPADTPPGPNVTAGTNPQFRFTVINSGNVTLTNVQVTDDKLGLIGSVPSLAPGESTQWIVTGTWALGQQVNTATATGDYLGRTFIASNPAYWVGVEVPAPAIDVLKDVSPDNGVTWYPADTPPGPNVIAGTNPQFRFTVINPSDVTLINVKVTDDVLGLIGSVPSLAPGASQQWIIVGTWALGQQVNIATATGEYLGQTFTASNPAYWVGVEAAAPAINIIKDVSPDNGFTWFAADTPPGPNVVAGTNPMFRIVVTNTGNVTLTNVQVNDNVFGLVGTVPSLAPGASQQWIVTGTWALGQHVNTATATGQYEGQTVTASNPAYWVGVAAPAPAIDVEKEVSPDNGVTWFDADTPPGPSIVAGTNPQFRFTVTNIGSVTLTAVEVRDDVLGLIGIVPTLAPGASAQWVVIGTWALGQQVNIATATGDYQGQTVTDTDPAYYVGVEAPAPAIILEKLISVDGGVTYQHADTEPYPILTAPQVPMYKIIVTNTGNVTLTGVSVTDTTFGILTLGGTLLPGESFTIPLTGTFAAGQHCNTAVVNAVYEGTSLTANDTACYVGIGPSIDIEKFVSVDNGVTWIDADTAPGPLLPAGVVPQFKFVVTNNGQVTLSNIVVNDSVLGLIGTLPSLAPGQSFQWIVIGS